MKTTKTKRDKINLIFSSFLVIGYIICAYFFSSLAKTMSSTAGKLIQIVILLIFGLLLFYATRVGEGKQVKRFSLAVLLLIDLPALYIILTAFVPALPFASAINPVAQQTAVIPGVQQVAETSAFTPSIILILACVALGYGLPYTFFSGYEIKEEIDVDAEAEKLEAVEGGLKEELAEADEAAEDAVETTQEAVEAEADEVTEIADEAQSVDDTVEEKEE